MFSFLSRARSCSAAINGTRIEVRRGETLLQAALRQGMDFPHSCRVGGCASCKCRLLAGRVRELTETGYILTEEELAHGFILACQSVPRGDVVVAVELSRRQAAARRGRVVQQEQLTHDITRLVIQLDQSLDYQAGQYAQLTLDCLAQQPRSFSFATPASTEAKVSFFVRQVPGGLFTGLVGAQSLLGQGVSVEGPYGDFHLRPAAAPLLLVAGGSGLAPLLAMLQDALARGVGRSVTLLFGAREERDLYAQAQIAELAGQWPAPFRFVPVLSAVAAEAPWPGARELVTALIPDLLEPGAHAYLCGPPAMVDSATALLVAHGVGREHIHADRFTTRQGSRPTAA